jgi:hypothetical protein
MRVIVSLIAAAFLVDSKSPLQHEFEESVPIMEQIVMDLAYKVVQ